MKFYFWLLRQKIQLSNMSNFSIFILKYSVFLEKYENSKCRESKISGIIFILNIHMR